MASVDLTATEPVTGTEAVTESATTETLGMVTAISWKKAIITILLSSVALFTTISNFLVLISFYLEPKLRNTFTFFVTNLAVTDFLMGSTSMFFYTVYTVLGYWPFGHFLCGMWIFLDSMLMGASIFTLVSISIDR